MTVTDEPDVDVREDVDPADDEDVAVAVELVRSGWVRLRWDGRTVRLRRPFFGELKRLRLALEDAGDAISERSDEVQAIARDIIADNEKLDADESLDEDERVRARRELTNRSKRAGRELTAYSDEVRIGWWRQVVELVGVDGELPGDDELPSWIADPFLPGKVLAHWRAVPLARG